MTYSFEMLHGYCSEIEQQLRIRTVVSQIEKQGLTQFFINPQKTFELARELKTEKVLPADYDIRQFSTTENMQSKLVEFFTKKIAEHMERLGNITSDEALRQTFGEIAVVLVVPPNGAHMLFNWLTEFTFQYRDKFCKAMVELKRKLDVYSGDEPETNISFDYLKIFGVAMYDGFERLINLYEEALPCGMCYKIDHKLWEYSRFFEFKKFDVSVVIEGMPFDRYFAAAFYYSPTYENRLNGHIMNEKYFQLPREKFKCKNELKAEIDEAFKALVFEYLKNTFNEEDEFFDANLSDCAVKLQKDNAMRVCFMYIISMMYVCYSETKRLDALLRFPHNG